MHSGKKRNLCGHYQEYLLIPTFKKRKDLYYDAISKKWTAKDVIVASDPVAKDVYDEKIIAGNLLHYFKYTHV